MVSTLYLGTCQDRLADILAVQLNAAAGTGDFFTPATVVVPNRYLAKWLRLWLAQHLGIVVNLKIEYLLERRMWQLLQEVDGREHTLPLHQLTDDESQLMILASLLDESGQNNDPFRSFLARPQQPRRRDFWRRAWQLAGRLAGLLRDYEYHRQDRLIDKWLAHQDGYSNAAAADLCLEHSQRDLFEKIMHEPDGLRARLGHAVGKRCLTLPQYAAEVSSLPPQQLRTFSEPPVVHLFGLMQISSLHVHTLCWLGEHYDLRLYHLNPLAGCLETLPSDPGMAHAALRELADRFREPTRTDTSHARGDKGLLGNWAQAGAESLWLMSDLLQGDRPFRVELVPTPARAGSATVLTCLQDHLINRPSDTQRKPQDVTVQVVACPGVLREVETVYQSILHNLQQDSTLRQTDVTVLVTDMPGYRPAIQAVFDRAPRPILYNLADYSAAELSPFGHGVIGLLDLALESFTRSRVFAVLLNPCFLARLGVDREQALIWLDWAEALGVYHGWDRQDKCARGYPNSPLYCWQLALRRLRLGRLMDVADEGIDRPAPQFQGVIPFADLASGDREQLDAFCRALEELLPLLVRLRTLTTSGEDWADVLRALVDHFLDVPDERPGEASVRDALFEALERLKRLDALREGKSGVPLTLVREFVQENLETLRATTGEFLTGGVTISALQPLLPVPFRIIYILGLGEGLFPGLGTLPTYDLRSRERCGGDTRPAETNRYLFLQALLSAREKVYLLYNCRELQKDQVLHPSSPILQLRRYLEEHILQGGKLEIVKAPLLGSDTVSLQGGGARASDCLVTYSETERLLAVEEAQQRGTLQLEANRAAEIERRLQKARRTFPLPPAADVSTAAIPTVTLAELRGFLRCPVEAALKRHLRLTDEESAEVSDDEPFYTCFPHDFNLITAFLKRFVARAVSGTVEEAPADWRPHLTALHEEWGLRSRVPEGAFAVADLARLEIRLRDRIDGLAELLGSLGGAAFCGPVLLGESVTPVGARQRFPAVTVPLKGRSEVRLGGTLPLVWRSKEVIDVLVLTNSSKRRVPAEHLSVPLLEPVLFFLALKAVQGPDASAARDWLGKRTFRVHIAHADGIVDFTYRSGDVNAREARSYLAELAADFLDRAAFDLLPFDLIVAGETLREAYVKENEGELPDPREYVQLLQEAIEEDGEQEHPVFRGMKLLEIVEVRVPDDALAKVRRRFRILDRGPARIRN